MPKLRDWVQYTPHSGIRRMLEHARDVESPLMLVNGDPNFTTPLHIIDAAARAARAGATGYAPGAGLPALREELADKVRRVNGFTLSPEQVCVTTGACGGLYTTLLLLAGAGDEVLVPDPGWSNYAAIVHTLGATAVPYPLRPDAGWTLDVAALEAMVTSRTRVILVNTPSNPTGSVESAENLTKLLEVAERHDLWLLADEAYDELVFDGKGFSAASLGAEDRVLTVFSLSKTYAMTGWRVGYVTGPAAFIRELTLHQEPVVSCASTISQHAALAALRGPQDCVHEMVAAYARRRRAVADALTVADVPFVLPSGGFFMMVDIRRSGRGSWDYALDLLRRYGVGTVPGVAFGNAGEGFLRITLAASDDVLDEGIQRLAASYHDLAPAT